MTHAECEIVANAGVQLREIAERLTLPPQYVPRLGQEVHLVSMLDAAALSISEVYGQLSALPLENEPDELQRRADAIHAADRAQDVNLGRDSA